MKATLLLICALPAFADGDIIASLDKLDARDELPLPPEQIVIVDLHVVATPPETWEYAAIYAQTSSGAVLHYEYDPDGEPLITAPGTANRFTTFLSTPRGRNADERFVSDGAVLISGSALPGPGPQFYPDLINVAYGEPPPLPPAVSEGYIARFALDLSAVVDPAFRQDSENIIVASSRPPGSVVLFESIHSQNQITSVHTHNGQSSFVLDWGVYGVPEPASIVVLLGGVLLLRPFARNSARRAAGRESP